jgi:hypothetical protein
MRRCHLHSLTRTRGAVPNRIASGITALVLLSATGLLVTLAIAKTPPVSSSQKKEKKVPALRWDPPRVDASLPSLSATPACSLPDVLTQTGQRAEELMEHLQNFIAHEQVRYEQTSSPVMLGMSTSTGIQEVGNAPKEMSFAAKYDYIVDFGEKSGAIRVHETRTPLAGTNDGRLGAILDKGVPMLALIFYPALRGDYEMRCEGATEWKDQRVWVVHFHQRKDKPPRTAKMETPTKIYPLSIKGRAWIAADSGQVLHLETNLMRRVPIIELEENAFSVDYAPVKFQSQDVEVWLPQFALGYTDFAKRRMITEHTFSDFQLFSVQTQETIQKPKQP